MQDTRFEYLKNWLKTLSPELGLDCNTLTSASSDASFRRYFRVLTQHVTQPSYIVMDAPTDKEDSRPFLQVAQLLRDAKIEVPHIFASDLHAGFLLMSDLGNQTLFSIMTPESAPHIYKKVSSTLIHIQKDTATHQLPLYDSALFLRELQLFIDWYLAKHLHYPLSEKENIALHNMFADLIKNLLQQPTTFVHRDFHSRNLMLTANDTIGVLDFQDAVRGPMTYDLVSIYRDAYLGWSEEQQVDWIIRYWELAKKEHLPVLDDFGTFYRDLEWMGLQRHLKVLGIFARLSHRDAKDGYLQDLPLVLSYTEKVAQRYAIFRPLVRILDNAQKRQRLDGFTF